MTKEERRTIQFGNSMYSLEADLIACKTEEERKKLKDEWRKKWGLK